MRFNQHKPLILHNIQRCFQSNSLSMEYFDDQELDETLTHSENLFLILSSRGIRTREEMRTQIRKWKAMMEDESVAGMD